MPRPAAVGGGRALRGGGLRGCGVDLRPNSGGGGFARSARTEGVRRAAGGQPLRHAPDEALHLLEVEAEALEAPAQGSGRGRLVLAGEVGLEDAAHAKTRMAEKLDGAEPDEALEKAFGGPDEMASDLAVEAGEDRAAVERPADGAQQAAHGLALAHPAGRRRKQAQEGEQPDHGRHDGGCIRPVGFPDARRAERRQAERRLAPCSTVSLRAPRAATERMSREGRNTYSVSIRSGVMSRTM